MTQIRITMRVAAPPERVFALLEDPRQWTLWHPSSRGPVDWPSDQSSVVTGSQVSERFRIAGFSGVASWTITACEPPHALELTTTQADADGKSRYDLHVQSDATVIERQLSYRRKGVLLRFLDERVFRRWVERAERKALENLKRLAEK